MIARITFLALTAVLVLEVAVGFVPSTTVVGSPSSTTAPASTTALQMANDEDLLRWARSSRSANADDNLVELKRPIGVVLAEDDDGNVFVETLAPNGNAARSGQVRFY